MMLSRDHSIKIFSILFLFTAAIIVVNDAMIHFDADRVSVKRQHQSAQRHWSAFYSQNYTYADSSFRYQYDIRNIAELIEPNQLVLSDLPSSYYLAAELPVFLLNAHAHHLRDYNSRQLIDGFYPCYIDQEESLSKVKAFIKRNRTQPEGKSHPRLKYWVINRDPINLNLRKECLATRGKYIATGLQHLGELIYQGEFLWLYQINAQPAEKQ